MMSIRSACRLCLVALLPAAFPAGLRAESPYEASALVRIHVTNELRATGEALVLTGRLLEEYNPVVIQKFSSPGVVLDAGGHIMTFLGYGRIFIERANSRFEIEASEGRRHRGDLVGIDHGNGAAVIHVPEGGLRRTSICAECDLHEGATVIAPVLQGPAGARFRATQVLSISPRGVLREQSGWVVRTNRPLLDVGQPLFTGDHRVLGFIVSQDPSGVRSVVYPVAELLASAQKIIEKNGDIRTGWLGVYPENIRLPSGTGVGIGRVVPDGPAHRAGLAPSDIVLRYNGRKVEDVLGLIHLVEDTPVGAVAELEILRRGQPLKLTAQIGERQHRNPLEDLMLDLQDPFEPARLTTDPGRTAGAERPRIGFDTVALTPELARFLEIGADKGLLVLNIARQSPADRAGIKNGDVILSVDGDPVDDPGRVSTYLRGLPNGSIVSVQVLRKNAVREVEVRLPDPIP